MRKVLATLAIVLASMTPMTPAATELRATNLTDAMELCTLLPVGDIQPCRDAALATDWGQ